MRSVIEKNTGLVIHVSDFQDNAVIATILSEKGLVNCIIKGAKKINTSTNKLAKLLTFIEFNYTANKQLATLTEGVVLENYSNIKLNINKYNYSLIVLDDLYHFADGISDYSIIYQFILDFFNIYKQSNYYVGLVSLFEIKLLYLLGVSPRFNSCAICGKKVISGGLSVKHGGLICDNCSINYSVNLNNDESIIYLNAYRTKLKDVSGELLIKLENSNICNFIEKYYEYHLDFKSKVKRVIYQLDNKGEIL